MNKDNPLKVLLVEDNEADALLLLENIMLNGVTALQVHTVQSLKQAFDFLQNNRVDALLLDLSLPDSQGLATIQKIKDADPSIPVVVLTGAEDEKTGIEALRLGVQDYLVKGRADGWSIARAVLYAVERKRGELALQKAHDELEQKVRERTLELQQSNQTLRMISECDQALVRATDEMKLIREICDIIRELGGYRMAWVGYAENDAIKSVRTIAAVGPDAGYLDEARITWADEEHGRGPTGTCIRTGAIRVCRDFRVDPDLDPWRDQALKRGYRSSIALPLRSTDRVFGALTIYAAAPDVFDENQITLLTELTGDLAFGITTLRMRAERDQAARVAEDRAKQLQALAVELSRAEQRERQRLAKILHDHLQQLLVAAKFNLATVKENVETPEARKTVGQVTDILDEAIKSARSLTADLSPPALYEKGLSAGLEWLGRQMKQKYGLQVEIKADPEAEPAAEPVGLFLFEAVRELLFNVVKHAGTDRVLVEAVRSNSEQIRVTVTDRGAGFDPGQLEADRSVSNQFGLFSIRERLNYLGGKMETESAPGQGSRFVLTAPARLAPANEGVAIDKTESILATVTGKTGAEAEKAAAGGHKIRVLLVDDHPVMRQGLTLVLRGQPDIEVVGEAGDGEEAIQWTRHLRPDVVLMDISLPRINGIEATRQIRDEFPETCVIGLSMHEKEDMALAMRRAGAKAYLAKGGPVEDLIAAVRSCAVVSADPEETEKRISEKKAK